MAKDTDYIIKIANPKQTRRIILENTRDVLKVLQGYEDFKKVRQQRTHLIDTFNNNVSEIKALVSEVRRMLPKVVLKDVKKPMMETAQKPVKELKKLEQELADIEEKLGSI